MTGLQLRRRLVNREYRLRVYYRRRHAVATTHSDKQDGIKGMTMDGIKDSGIKDSGIKDSGMTMDGIKDSGIKKRVQFVANDVTARAEYEPDDLEPLTAIRALVIQRKQQMDTIRGMCRRLIEVVRKDCKLADFKLGDSIAHLRPDQRLHVELFYCQAISSRVVRYWSDVTPSPACSMYDCMCACLRDISLL